jgi:hypothetical protein
MTNNTKIVVNERLVEFTPACITYEEVVALAGFIGNEYFVAYSSKRDGLVIREGRMCPGCLPVLVTDVMAFRVSHAGNA